MRFEIRLIERFENENEETEETENTEEIFLNFLRCCEARGKGEGLLLVFCFVVVFGALPGGV